MLALLFKTNTSFPENTIQKFANGKVTKLVQKIKTFPEIL